MDKRSLISSLTLLGSMVVIMLLLSIQGLFPSWSNNWFMFAAEIIAVITATSASITMMTTCAR